MTRGIQDRSARRAAIAMCFLIAAWCGVSWGWVNSPRVERVVRRCEREGSLLSGLPVQAGNQVETMLHDTARTLLTGSTLQTYSSLALLHRPPLDHGGVYMPSLGLQRVRDCAPVERKAVKHYSSNSAEARKRGLGSLPGGPWRS